MVATHCSGKNANEKPGLIGVSTAPGKTVFIVMFSFDFKSGAMVLAHCKAAALAPQYSGKVAPG